MAEDKGNRFGDGLKLLPVIFIISNIAGLYFIFTLYHLIPLLSNPDTTIEGSIQMFVFNVITALLLTCYVKSIITHPGTIPEEDPRWISAQFTPTPRLDPQTGKFAWTEQKKSGERRQCKWCNKYKPDRCHHCRVCQTCILKMDHHCPWIYNCVGFKNHKFFFLLLFYSVLDTHFIVWTMRHTVFVCMDPSTPFFTMFWVLFGETLAFILCVASTVFFAFHVCLVLRAMTTIEFCEKALKRTEYKGNAYDVGLMPNLKAVLGDNMLCWAIPCSPPSGTGLSFTTEDSPFKKDVETGRGMKYGSTKDRPHHRKKGAGTGAAPDSEWESDVSEAMSSAR